jgi:hypothetical protein
VVDGSDPTVVPRVGRVAKVVLLVNDPTLWTSRAKPLWRGEMPRVAESEVVSAATTGKDRYPILSLSWLSITRRTTSLPRVAVGWFETAKVSMSAVEALAAGVVVGGGEVGGGVGSQAARPLAVMATPASRAAIRRRGTAAMVGNERLLGLRRELIPGPDPPPSALTVTP